MRSWVTEERGHFDHERYFVVRVVGPDLAQTVALRLSCHEYLREFGGDEDRARSWFMALSDQINKGE